jgi:hypothetical protein
VLQAKQKIESSHAPLDLVKTDKIRRDGDKFYKCVDINDSRNRYVLTREDTQYYIAKETGAEIICRGKYYPDRKMADEYNPPLHLRVVGRTREIVAHAVKRIEDCLENALMISNSGERIGFQPVDRVSVDIDPDSGFPIRSKIVGPGGSYIKHIQQETDARVTFKGKGSGYVDPSTGKEADEPLYIQISCPTEELLLKAKHLVQDLLHTVRIDYQQWRFSAAKIANYAPLPPGPPPPVPPPPKEPHPNEIAEGGRKRIRIE